MTPIERELRFLKAHAVISTAVIGVLLLGGFRQAAPSAQPARGAEKVKFDEIDVQRINVIEPDGKLRMVISNAARSQGPLYKGRPFFYTGVERPRTGIIFFNEVGTETGGLIYGGRQLGDTGYTGLGHLSFDQYNQDQVFVIQYVDRNGKRRVGVQINDRHNTNIFEWANRRDSLRRLPDSPAKAEALQRLQAGEPDDPRVAERVYIGRDTLKSAILKLSDRLGKPRIRLLVDSLGSARLEFLDADGRVTHRLPDASPGGGR
jgi:catechol 2,3-dioxygenase-like lactoylglutathione lyase family enzyme